MFKDVTKRFLCPFIFICPIYNQNAWPMFWFSIITFRNLRLATIVQNIHLFLLYVENRRWSCLTDFTLTCYTTCQTFEYTLLAHTLDRIGSQQIPLFISSKPWCFEWFDSPFALLHFVPPGKCVFLTENTPQALTIDGICNL